MRRALLGVLSAAALGTAAVAAGGSAAVHSPTGIYDAALLPPPGGAAAGTATLTDLPANDTLAVSVQGLVPGAAYSFHVHETEAPGDPCLVPGPHEPHAGWVNTTLVADPAGLGVGLATAARFTLHHDETYWVDVETAEGAVVACGVLQARPAA